MWRKFLTAKSLTRTIKLESVRFPQAGSAAHEVHVRGLWTSSIARSPLPSFNTLKGITALNKKGIYCDDWLDIEKLKQVKYSNSRCTWNEFTVYLDYSLASFIDILEKEGSDKRFKSELKNIYEFNEVYKKIDKSIRDINYTSLEDVSKALAIDTMKHACLDLERLEQYKEAVDWFITRIKAIEYDYDPRYCIFPTPGKKITDAAQSVRQDCEVLSNHLGKHMVFFESNLEAIKEDKIGLEK
jgi:hypothetical protein